MKNTWRIGEAVSVSELSIYGISQQKFRIFYCSASMIVVEMTPIKFVTSEQPQYSVPDICKVQVWA